MKFDTKSPLPTNPSHHAFESSDFRSNETSKWYKPYVLKISPRAKIKLYSPSPLPRYHNQEFSNQAKYFNNENKSFTKIRNKKTFRFKYNNIVEKKQENEFKALPVYINQYTRTYADKLKKVIEVCEAANFEVNFFNK